LLWEPHLEVSKVLLGLLDMASEAAKWVPSQKYGLPLTPGTVPTFMPIESFCVCFTTFVVDPDSDALTQKQPSNREKK
jgi:hypothetical protein